MVQEFRGTASCLQSQHVNAAVLLEMAVERKGPSNATTFEHGERDRVAESPVLIDVASEDLSGFLFFGGEYPHDWQTARQQALTRNRPSELSYEECVRLRFDVIGHEARAPFGRDVTCHRDGTCMVGTSASSSARMALESQRTARVTDRGWRVCRGRLASRRRRARHRQGGTSDGREKTRESPPSDDDGYGSERRSLIRGDVRPDEHLGDRPAESTARLLTVRRPTRGRPPQSSAFLSPCHHRITTVSSSQSSQRRGGRSEYTQKQCLPIHSAGQFAPRASHHWKALQKFAAAMFVRSNPVLADQVSRT